jgi:hypothetical protein
MRTRRQALIKDLSRFHHVVLIATLVVLYYRVHTKCGVLLEISMSSHVSAFARLNLPLNRSRPHLHHRSK